MPAPPRRLELTPRGRGLLLLIGLAVGAAWLSGSAYPRIAASLLIAPLLVDLLFKPRHLERLQLRVAPRRTEAGRPFFERIEIANASSCTLHELVLREPLTAFRGPTLIEHLPSGHGIEITLPGRSRRRSHLLARTFVVESSHPLGLLHRRTMLPVAADLVTEPARIRLPAEAMRTTREGEPDFRDDDRPGGGDFHSLREYRHDEDARLVHARRSAALGTLVRKVVRGQRPREVGVVLDLRRSPARAAGVGRRRFEHGLSTCASLLDILHTQKAIVHCVVLGGDRHRHERLATASEVDAFLTFLSEVEPTLHQSWHALPAVLLAECASCFWIPAGGFVAREDIAQLGSDVVLLGEVGS